MSLLLKAFPYGRPRPHARNRYRSITRVLPVAVTLAVSLVILGLPLSGPAQARTAHQHSQHGHVKAAKQRAAKQRAAKQRAAKQRAAKQRAAKQRAAKQRAAKQRAAKQRAAKQRAAKQRARAKHKARPKVPGQPPANYAMPEGSFFGFPNKGARAKQQIRGKVLATVRSTWGGPRDAYGAPLRTNGSIKLASWTFDDWKLARALVAAKKRGVTVQIVVAKAANQGHASWYWLREHLGHRLHRKGVPATASTWSFARYCRGSCRGRGGTAHSKYYLFHNVGAARTPWITMQTSMNLTTFAFTNQWNQAQVWHSRPVYADYVTVFAQSLKARPVLPDPYRVRYPSPTTVDYFFPRYGVTPQDDPAMQLLAPVSCTGSTVTGNGRTRINVIQYAIYGDRGLWIAKRLRALWEAGCDVAILYSIANRPVLSVLRSPRGRGPVPMKQSVVTDGYGTITKYNHSKWVTVVGHLGGSTRAYVTFSGSANWSDIASTDDEQMERTSSSAVTVRYLAAFARTWRQRSSHHPGFGTMPVLGGRVMPTFARDVPANEPRWGVGVFRYMLPD